MVTPSLFSDKVLCFLMSVPVETTGQEVERIRNFEEAALYRCPITLLKK